VLRTLGNALTPTTSLLTTRSTKYLYMPVSVLITLHSPFKTQFSIPGQGRVEPLLH
jgi:hypothetical protein